MGPELEEMEVVCSEEGEEEMGTREELIWNGRRMPGVLVPSPFCTAELVSD